MRPTDLEYFHLQILRQIYLTNGGWSGTWPTGGPGSDPQAAGSICCASSFSLSWSVDGYPTSSRSQAPFPCCYKSLLDLVTCSDWSISTAPRSRWKISTFSKGRMAFVHPTVTDHGADRGAPFTSQAHLQSMVISGLLHGFLLRHLSPLSSFLLIYLHLISVRPVSSAPALVH